MTRSNRALVAVLLAFALAACGSTVQVGGEAGAPGGGTDGLGAPGVGPGVTGPVGAPLATTAPGGGPGGTGGPVTRPTGTATDGGASARGGGDSLSGVSMKDGPGVTARTITIGVPYDPDVAQGQAALGSSVPIPDVKRYFEVVLADVNAKGGIAGRTVKAVFYAVRSTDGKTTDQRSEEVCAFFAQDHPVLAVVPAFSPELSRCLAKSGVASAAGSLAGYDETTYRSLATFFDVGALATDRIAQNLVTALQAQRYFTGWNVRTGEPGDAPVKVGILAPDSAQWRRTVPQVLVPALARIGVKVDPANIVIWHFPDTAASQSESVAQIQSAVLRFQSNGVTHFIPAEVNSAAFFSTPADTQRYRPRYALNSATGVGAHAGGLIPYSMLNGAVGMGWSPAIDLSVDQGKSPAYTGPGTTACLDTFRRAGISAPSSNERAVALLVCDGVKLIKASVEAIPSTQAVSATSLLGGLESLGSGFRFAGLLSGRYGPGRHYPISDGWQMHWDSTCRCQAYSGPRYVLR